MLKAALRALQNYKQCTHEIKNKQYVLSPEVKSDVESPSSCYIKANPYHAAATTMLRCR